MLVVLHKALLGPIHSIDYHMCNDIQVHRNFPLNYLKSFDVLTPKIPRPLVVVDDDQNIKVSSGVIYIKGRCGPHN